MRIYFAGATLQRRRARLERHARRRPAWCGARSLPATGAGTGQGRCWHLRDRRRWASIGPTASSRSWTAPTPTRARRWEVGYAYRKKPIVLVRTDMRATGSGGWGYNAMLSESATIRVDAVAAPMDQVADEVLAALARLELRRRAAAPRTRNRRARSSADRASASGAEGRGFESRRARHFLLMTLRPLDPSRDLPAVAALLARTRANGDLSHPGGTQWWLRELGRDGFEAFVRPAADRLSQLRDDRRQLRDGRH